MVTGIEISKLNPIRLRLLENLSLYSDCFRQEYFAQKYNNEDMTNIQVLTPEGYSIESINFLDRRGLAVQSIPFHSHTDIVLGVMAWDITVNFSTVQSGEYVIKATFITPDEKISLYSDKICVGQHDCTVLINYTNSENTQSVLFNTNIEFFLRADGGFIPATMLPDSNDVIYVDQLVNHKIIRSTPYVRKKITFGGPYGIPDWFGQILNCVFSCDSVNIDTKYYTKTDGAKWEFTQFDNRDLRSWSLQLIENDQDVYEAGKIVTCEGEFADFVEQEIVEKINVIGYDSLIAIDFGGGQLIKT